jgi:hypothetical protein
LLRALLRLKQDNICKKLVLIKEGACAGEGIINFLSNEPQFGGSEAKDTAVEPQVHALLRGGSSNKRKKAAARKHGGSKKRKKISVKRGRFFS